MCINSVAVLSENRKVQDMWAGGGVWDVLERSEHIDAHGLCEVGHTRGNKNLTVSLV